MIDLTRNAHPGVRQFTFPDGQPHVAIAADGAKRVTLVARIRNGDELIRVLLATDALRAGGVERIKLIVTYLMGARMDRRMPVADGRSQPFTLKVIADILKLGDFESITLYDPHSDVAAALLNAVVVLPAMEVRHVVHELGDVVLVAPDAGAAKKVAEFGAELQLPVIQCLKKRDVLTGKLSGFQIVDPGACANKTCLIVDDICDGGGTFTGIGALLKDAGASSVNLYVTHGIFSKGLPIENVDRVFTTESYQSFTDIPKCLTVQRMSC